MTACKFTRYLRAIKYIKNECLCKGCDTMKNDITLNIKEAKYMTIDEIKNIITPLVSPYPIKRVILFGSYARGEASENSDVDLIIDSEGQLSGFDFFGIAGLMIKKIPIRVDVFELREINRPSILFDDINKEGVVIYES